MHFSVSGGYTSASFYEKSQALSINIILILIGRNFTGRQRFVSLRSLRSAHARIIVMNQDQAQDGLLPPTTACTAAMQASAGTIWRSAHDGPARWSPISPGIQKTGRKNLPVWRRRRDLILACGLGQGRLGRSTESSFTPDPSNPSIFAHKKTGRRIFRSGKSHRI